MNRERAKELREVFNAFCDGKEIQFIAVDGSMIWEAALTPAFHNRAYEYRIKPEPQVIYVCSFQGSNPIVADSISEAPFGWAAKKFIEVIE